MSENSYARVANLLTQALHYSVIEEQCPPADGTPAGLANQAIMLLSYLHVAFQPLVVNWSVWLA